MPRLSLYLLGPPRIESDGEPVDVDTRKATALLAYLALTGERHRRAALVNLLWPELDERRGRAALRRTLSTLRRTIDVPVQPSAPKGSWLDADYQSVELRPKEFALLETLLSGKGRVFDRDTLLERVWGEDEYIDHGTIDVHV